MFEPPITGSWSESHSLGVRSAAMSECPSALHSTAGAPEQVGLLARCHCEDHDCIFEIFGSLNVIETLSASKAAPSFSASEQDTTFQTAAAPALLIDTRHWTAATGYPLHTSYGHAQSQNSEDALSNELRSTGSPSIQAFFELTWHVQKPLIIGTSS